MAIVKMHKFHLLFLQSKQNQLLKEIQLFRNIQLIDVKKDEENLQQLLKANDEENSSYVENKLNKIKYAIEFLRGYIPEPKGLKALTKDKENVTYDQLKELVEGYEIDEIYEALKSLESKLSELKSNLLLLNQENEFYEKWAKLDLCNKELKALNNTGYFIGTIPKKNYLSLEEYIKDKKIPLSIEIVNEDKDLNYVFALYPMGYILSIEELFKEFEAAKISINLWDTPIKIIEANKIKASNLAEEKDLAEKTILKYKDKLPMLEKCFDWYYNKLEMHKSTSNMAKTCKTVLMEGWVPEDKKNDFSNLLNRVLEDSYYIEFHVPEEDEVVPIKLKNKFIIEPFESITAMYSLPGYKEIDPTPILAPFLFIFFGMMLSDAGYGFVMLIGTTLALKLLKLSKGQEKLVKLFQYLSISTIFFGILYGSYFGDILSKSIMPLWLDPSSNPITVLILSIVMGVIHIYVALGVKAYLLIRDKKPLDAIFDVGFWYFTLTGALLMLVGSMSNQAMMGTIGKYLAIVGTLGLLLTQGRSNKTIFGKFAGGLYGLYGITGYLGDILSYSRLLALGLATGLIGSSFNLIIGLLGNPILKITFGTVIFIVGHVFNLLINVLGAYVHAARLQYLEFFNKFYEGGGKEFKPLSPVDKYIQINND